jgi:hypothetical protein
MLDAAAMDRNGPHVEPTGYLHTVGASFTVPASNLQLGRRVCAQHAGQGIPAHAHMAVAALRRPAHLGGM